MIETISPLIPASNLPVNCTTACNKSGESDIKCVKIMCEVIFGLKKFKVTESDNNNDLIPFQDPNYYYYYYVLSHIMLYIR